MSTNMFLDEALFMKAMGQNVVAADPDQAKLYLQLCAEEFCEMLTGAIPDSEPWLVFLQTTLFGVIDRADLRAAKTIDVFDGIIDTLVVVINLGISLGLPMQEGWNEVLRSNMAKVGPDGKVRRREDGKVLKPDDWTPPDLAKILLQAEGASATPSATKVEFVGGLPMDENIASATSVSQSDRFLNLAMLELGSAISLTANKRNTGHSAGTDYGEIAIVLSRATAHLAGKLWEPPMDLRDREELAFLRKARADLLTQVGPDDTSSYAAAMRDAVKRLTMPKSTSVGNG